MIDADRPPARSAACEQRERVESNRCKQASRVLVEANITLHSGDTIGGVGVVSPFGFFWRSSISELLSMVNQSIII